MNYRYLDMETYPRKSHFAYFDSLSYPYTCVTVNVDITELQQTIKARRLPFFLTVCYCVSRAANQVPQFRQRILEQRIVEFDSCRTSHTVALSDGTYCYCDLRSDLPFDHYLRYAAQEQENAKKAGSIEESETDALEKIFISTVPWLTYTALVNPVPFPADSNPRITWGKYFAQDGKILLPLSVLCHHALVDGLHIAAFYDQLNGQIRRTASSFP